jgi:hypothetical protein
VGTIGVAQVQLPVAVAVGFVDTLMRVVPQFGQQVLGFCRRLIVRTRLCRETDESDAGHHDDGQSQRGEITIHGASPYEILIPMDASPVAGSTLPW